MNRVREVAKQQGRKLVWLGVQIGVRRANFDKKLDADNFTAFEREQLAKLLGVTITELFPDVAIAEVVEA